MSTITVSKPEFPTIFGGFGFHNSEALFYRLCKKEQFDQKICKCYRELSPGFMRTFAGYADWTKESMDTFADYYERMQKWTDTPIYFAAAKGELHFSDEDRRQYAEDVAEKLDYLINVRGVKQLRYYCFSNEMSMMDWGGLLKDLPLFKKYHEYLYDAFRKRGLNVGLLATDAASVSNWHTLDYAIAEMKRITEDFSLHAYIDQFSPDDPAFYDWFFELCRENVMKCIRCDGKRLILGEYGLKKPSSWEYLPGAIKDLNAFNYEGEGAKAALMLAEGALAAINAGVFALALWTFVDYPDPYVCHYAEHDEYAKKWGECERFISRTQDVKYNKYGLIKWEDDGDYGVREAYWCVGLLSRFCRRNAKVLELANDDPLLRVCGLLNKDGSISVLIVNRHTEPTSVSLTLSLKHLADQPDFRVYEFDSACPPVNEFGDLQDASAALSAQDGTLDYTLLPSSLTVLSTDYSLREEIPVLEVRREGELLLWQTIDDPEHCYYRVYRGSTPDFVPSKENQIASTVAETLDLSARYADDAAIRRIKGDCYKVLSVGKRR